MGPQPTEPDLEWLKRESVRTVFDFRHPRETRSANAEPVRPQRLGYVNIPVRLQALSDTEVDELLREAERYPQAFLHTAVSGCAPDRAPKATHQAWPPSHR
ncbi:MAG: tyrosine-protein phosphatase [Acidiferrobacteraceae bacterium]